MDDHQPYFRFNPHAYEHGHIFERSADVCDVCSRPCVWKYTGSIFAKQSPSACARCIADGELARFLDDEHFALQDIELHEADPELAAELLQRTPGVACFNPFEWPVLDGKPLAFFGNGEDEGLLAIPDVRSAIEAAFAEAGWEFEGPTPYALIFQELEGERFRVAIDLD
ncbi:CbrC family protein [Sphingomonas sp.]|jgi:hypothetical protein|uniref:CbrC family protein n=1 Tax=Sphingomonas sp. TaxID=28214 RepID=UPI002ED9B765